MKSALLLFRQAYARELAPSVTGSFDAIRVEGIVGTLTEGIEILQRTPIDVVVIGPSFIESVHVLAAAHCGDARPEFIVLHRGEGTAVRARAHREGIEVVISLSNGISETLNTIHRWLNDKRQSNCQKVDKPLGECARRAMIQVNDDIDCEIVRLVAAGFADRDIAGIVHMSHQTIRNRVSRILGETGARNRTHLACLYFERTHEGLHPFEKLDGPYQPIHAGT